MATPGFPHYAAGQAAWERWEPIWHRIFFALLVVATGLSLLGSRSAGRRPAIVVLALALGAWYRYMAVSSDLREPPSRLILYFAVALVLWVGLVWFHPGFLLLAFSWYSQVFALLRLGWALAAAALLTVLMVVLQIQLLGAPPAGVIWAGVGVTAGGSVLAILMDRVIVESEQRQRLIVELEEARRDLAAAERQARALTERQRLSREIHDTLAQGFASVVVHLEAALAGLSPQPSGPRRHVEQARQTARDGLAEARRFVWALRPEALERNTLGEALTRLAENGGSDRLRIEATTTGQPRPLPPEVESPFCGPLRSR